jgi:putative ABC transport system permease protein
LGAQKKDMLRLVVGQGLALVAIGIVFGVAGAFGATRFLRSLLYGVEPTDALTLLMVSSLLLLVGAVACLIPARYATRVAPMVALRYE